MVCTKLVQTARENLYIIFVRYLYENPFIMVELFSLMIKYRAASFDRFLCSEQKPRSLSEGTKPE